MCVLERRHVLGGCATTEELWPGYKVSTAAYVISLFLPQIIRELKLKEYGLTILPRNPSSFTPLPDGRSLLLGPDAELCRREISKFSTQDAEAYPRYNAFLERVAAVLEPVLSQAAPDPLPLPEDWRNIGLGKRMRDGKKLWALYRALGELGADLPQAVELLTGAARPILDRWFESDVLKATLATDAIIGAFLSISSPGSAYVLLHHVMGEAGGARGVWGYVQGGMGGLADVARRARAATWASRSAASRPCSTSSPTAAGPSACGSKTARSSTRRSSPPASTPISRSRSSSTPDELPEYFRDAVARIDYSSASAKINLALAEPPRFTCLPDDGVGPHHHGTMHIGPSLDYLERAYDDAKYGRPSERADPRNDDGHQRRPHDRPARQAHPVSMFVQYAPYKLADGNWDDIKEKFADRCIEVLAEYAPNVPSAIEHRQVLSPLDLERTFGITGGNIMQGAMSAASTLLLPPRRRLGRPSHADPRPVPVRRRQPPRRRRPRRLRQKRRRRNPARYLIHHRGHREHGV